MDILVLLKQVPATESLIQVAENGVSIKAEGLKYVINPYDELAVEEALKIREALGGSVTIISMGPAKAAEAVRTALAMGADRGLLVDPGTLVCDGLSTARLLAAAAGTLPYDLIIAGHRAVDDDNFQVGTAVAEWLGIPNISMAIKVTVADGAVRCLTTMDGGTREIEAPLPALITTQRGLNEPRYASLPGIMKAKKKPLETKTPADLGIDAGALTPLSAVKALKLPPQRKSGRLISGDTVQAQVTELVRLLKEEAKVL